MGGGRPSLHPARDAARKEALLHILVADDSAAYREALSYALTRALGATVVEAGGGAEAVALADQERPDVVLVDMRMPDVDGLTVVARLRALPWGPRIVLMSAHDDLAVATRALAGGAHAFAHKTDGLAAVLDAVRSAIETR